MPVRMHVIAATLALALPALAWEPQSPAAVQSRIDELQKAWSGKSAEEIAQDKVAACAAGAAAVGLAERMEDGARSHHLLLRVGKAGLHAGASAPAPTPPATAGRPLDWWYDDAAGAFYTLVVDAR